MILNINKQNSHEYHNDDYLLASSFPGMFVNKPWYMHLKRFLQQYYKCHVISVAVNVIGSQ